MKGYHTLIGYMGYVPSMGRYVLFATEEEYIELYTSMEEKENE